MNALLRELAAMQTASVPNHPVRPSHRVLPSKFSSRSSSDVRLPQSSTFESVSAWDVNGLSWLVRSPSALEETPSQSLLSHDVSDRNSVSQYPGSVTEESFIDSGAGRTVRLDSVANRARSSRWSLLGDGRKALDEGKDGLESQDQHAPPSNPLPRMRSRSLEGPVLLVRSSVKAARPAVRLSATLPRSRSKKRANSAKSSKRAGTPSKVGVSPPTKKKKMTKKKRTRNEPAKAIAPIRPNSKGPTVRHGKPKTVTKRVASFSSSSAAQLRASTRPLSTTVEARVVVPPPRLHLRWR